MLLSMTVIFHRKKRIDVPMLPNGLITLWTACNPNIFIAGQRLNDLTGYSGIETLKKDIEQQGMFSFTSLEICPDTNRHSRV